MLSIVVCTYNRAHLLTRLLDQFEQVSEWLNLNAELIVIDNNSSDDTEEVINEYQKKLNLRAIKETRQGLSSARNRALNEFKGDALLFLDDDVSVSLHTLKTYLKLLKDHNDIGFFGGKVVVDWQGEKPRWLKSNDLVLLNGLFVQYDLGSTNINYTDDTPMPFGANFILRRGLIDKVGFFDINLGVIGDEIGRGEETDYFIRARSLGFKGLYCAEATVGHYYQKERIGLLYMYRYGIEKGRAAYLIDNDYSSGYIKASLSFFVRGVYQLLKGRRDRFYQCVINIGIKRGLYTESNKSKEGPSG